MSRTLMPPGRILVLGASGMLGNAALRVLAEGDHEVWGTIRSGSSARRFPDEMRQRLVDGVDVENIDSLIRVFGDVRPDVVVNCVGLVKQLADANDPLAALPINALLPHRLARLCATVGARLVHISTDCVFDGTTGAYVESDRPNAVDLYGRSKLLGEVDYAHAITLRTSIIGRELNSTHGLVDWFLSQQGSIRGYSRAIFSGLTTVELARVIRDLVLPRPDLRGLYHVSVDAISKFDLLTLVAEVYGKTIEIVPDETLVIDRSLDSTRFREATGYQLPQWRELIVGLRDFGLPGDQYA
jgi:dTDP-4-dehydrorhamnose reductase